MAWNSKVDAGWVTLDIEPPLERLDADLRALGRDLTNFRTPLRDSIKNVIIPSIATNFEVGGRPQWEPLSPETLEKRARMGTGSQILVERGGLKRAATQFSRWDVRTDGASISNWPQREMVKAAVHQGGASFRFSGRAAKKKRGGTGHIPARPFLLIQADDAEKIDQVFLDWVERQARRWWRR